MSRPYNDQWVLRRAGGERQRRQAQRVGSSATTYTASRERNFVPGPAAPAAARALSDALRVIGRLGKRPRWIDRDT
jgi:hypothetical protein